jgi:hypothetical protein
MRAKGKVGPVLILGAVMGLSACSPQTKLARQFAGADCVVVTNVYHGIGISVTGDEARRVVRAVSSARKLPPETLTSAEVRTEFYRGTNFLGAVLGCGSLFGNKDGGYEDESGVFKALDERYREQHRISILQER